MADELLRDEYQSLSRSAAYEGGSSCNMSPDPGSCTNDDPPVAEEGGT
jgi:hypothetical protein